jgi:hypothetical protein
MSLAYLTDIIILLAAAVLAVPLARIIGLVVILSMLITRPLAQEALAIAGEGRKDIEAVVDRFREEYYSFAKKKPLNSPPDDIDIT